MVIKETLTDLVSERKNLLETISKKITASKTTCLNENIDNRLKVDIKVVDQLLNSFESRFRECEILYFTYLKNVNHEILCGDATDIPLYLYVELTYSSCVFKKDIFINDKALYRGIIDAQFRHFILAMSSFYEVLVKLAEILIRKVILHIPSKRPLNAPLDQYILSLKNLVELRYRKKDGYYNCISSNEKFLNKYLSTVSQLRNSFMHGFSTNLESDTANYKVIKFDEKMFTAASPELNVDLFSTELIIMSGKFVSEILAALDKSIKHHKVFIPA